jgi:PhoPQ-activated pathogenicity-related protein
MVSSSGQSAEPPTRDRARCATLRRAFCHLCVLLVVGASAGARGQTLPAEPSGALAAYVAKPDPTFSWRVQRRYDSRDGDVVELHLESQTWQGVLWKHQLLIIHPNRVADDGRALFIVGGGRWRDEYEATAEEVPLPEDADLFVAMARVLRTPVIVLAQVPYQPLFGMSEDRLIAHTFDRYLATGDAEWPLLLPMVKSVVRAFDAASAESEREWGAPLDRFTVIGGSKRGWTTWLTAAVDSRVTALAPVVIDALNMERHFPHQVEAWGASSAKIAPYTDLGLDKILGSPQGEALREIVDPFSYRTRLTQPKLVILATNDEYFPLDSANLYFGELGEPKRLLYLPNEPHSVQHYGPVIRALRALHDAAGGGEPLPPVDWEYRAEEGGDIALCIRAPDARAMQLWRAVSADRDFRDAEWSVAADSGSASTRFLVRRPTEGYVAVLGQVAFGRLLRAFTLSTGLDVISAPGEPPYGTKPLGVAGVCANTKATVAVQPAP